MQRILTVPLLRSRFLPAEFCQQFRKGFRWNRLKINQRRELEEDFFRSSAKYVRKNGLVFGGNLVWHTDSLAFQVTDGYYYWIAKIRKLALEKLPRRSHGCRPIMEQIRGGKDLSAHCVPLSTEGTQI